MVIEKFIGQRVILKHIVHGDFDEETNSYPIEVDTHSGTKLLAADSIGALFSGGTIEGEMFVPWHSIEELWLAES